MDLSRGQYQVSLLLVGLPSKPVNDNLIGGGCEASLSKDLETYSKKAANYLTVAAAQAARAAAKSDQNQNKKICLDNLQDPIAFWNHQV